MAMLLVPLAMAISAITAKNGHIAIKAMANGNITTAIIGIQWKSMEKLTQQSWFQLSSTFHSKVMAIWSFVLGAYIAHLDKNDDM